MSTHIRVLQGFKRMTDQQVVNTTGAVLHGLPGNDAFPNPPAELKMLATAFEELNTAFAAQAHGGPAATAEKNNKRDVVITLLRRLAHYVQDNCENNLATLLSSGFQAVQAGFSRSTVPVETPSIIQISRGMGTELVMRITAVARAKCYEVRWAAADGTTLVNWKNELFTDSRSIKVGGLTPGVTYSFQVRAVGGPTRYSDWSNAVSCMCA